MAKLLITIICVFALLGEFVMLQLSLGKIPYTKELKDWLLERNPNFSIQKFFESTHKIVLLCMVMLIILMLFAL